LARLKGIIEAKDSEVGDTDIFFLCLYQSLPHQHQEKLKFFTEKQEQKMREIKTLNAALQAYMARPPSPPPLLPVEIIINMIEEPLLDAVREYIRTLLLQ